VLVQSFAQATFVWYPGVERSAGWSVVNASLGKQAFSTWQGLIGRIWVLVPMDCWSETGELSETGSCPSEVITNPVLGFVLFPEVSHGSAYSASVIKHLSSDARALVQCASWIISPPDCQLVHSQ